MLPELTACVALLALTGYVVLGGADFGAGFWDLTAGGAERGAPVRAMIKRAMSPVWEANHVWLIFLLVVLWTGFPEAFGSITSTLAIPLFVAALGIVLRGGAFALKGEAATIAEARALGATFALASVIVPFFLGACRRRDRGGRGARRQRSRRRVVELDRRDLDRGRPARGRHGRAPGGGLPRRRRTPRGEVRARGRVPAPGARLGRRRRRAGARGPAGRALGRPLDCSTTSPPAPGWPACCSRGPRGWSRSALEWRERFELARYTAAAAVTAIVAGWAVAQEPYLLPPDLTVEQAAAADATLVALLVATALGMLILIPALAWLFRLALSGRIAYEDKPRP